MLDAASDVTRFLAAVMRAKGKAEQKAAIIDLYRFGQTTPQADYLVEAVSGPLMIAVQRLFRDLALMVPLTERRRRQVIFAVIARLEETGQMSALEASQDGRLALLESLFCDRSSDLIAQWYGACPPGFLGLLGRIGETAVHARSYGLLAEVVRSAPEMTGAILRAGGNAPIRDEFIEMLAALPRHPAAPAVARGFDTPAHFRRFLEAYGLMTGSDGMEPAHLERIAKGEAPGHLIESLYLGLKFQLPVITAPGVRYAASGAELASLAIRFRNCLRGEVDAALRGLNQFYTWEPSEAEPVVFSIVNDAPFGWCLQQCAHRGNARVSPETRQRLCTLIAPYGVREGRAMGWLMRPFRTGIDDIDFEELMAPENAGRDG